MVDRRILMGGAVAALGAAFGLSRSQAAQGAQFEVTKSEAEWRRILTPEQYYVLRDHGTERAGTSPLDHEKRKGAFHCAGCDLPLYSSETKYNSGTGWPSFWQPLPNAVGHVGGQFVVLDANRSALPALRRAFGARVRGRTSAHRLALLHERRGDEIQTGFGLNGGSDETDIRIWARVGARGDCGSRGVWIASCRHGSGRACRRADGDCSCRDRGCDLRRRVFLVRGIRLRQSARRDLDDFGLHRRQDGQPDLSRSFGRRHGTRRGGQDRVRSRRS